MEKALKLREKERLNEIQQQHKATAKALNMREKEIERQRRLIEKQRREREKKI